MTLRTVAGLRGTDPTATPRIMLTSRSAPQPRSAVVSGRRWRGLTAVCAGSRFSDTGSTYEPPFLRGPFRRGRTGDRARPRGGPPLRDSAGISPDFAGTASPRSLTAVASPYRRGGRSVKRHGPTRPARRRPSMALSVWQGHVGSAEADLDGRDELLRNRGQRRGP